MDEEQIDALCREAPEEEKPVPSWAKAMGERASAEQGQISRWWQVQGNALPVHDSLTGD